MVRPSHALLAACGGFLIATLWFDLMFDVQALHAAALSETAVASIAAYYRRVTTDAHPMQLLIGVVMAVTVLGSASTLLRRSDRRLRWTALFTSAIPIGLAAVRILPNAVRLGARAGSLAEQSALARSILADHLFCFASIAAFTTIQVVLVSRSQAPRDGS